MAIIDFRVTEVNDLSKDGTTSVRVVMEAKHNQMDGTGPRKTDPDDPAARAPFEKDAPVEGRIELVMNRNTQAVHYTLGSVVPVTFPVVPVVAPPSSDDVPSNDARVGNRLK